MLIGYNTNVPYKGKVYHVQTEDSGLSNPAVVTLLYFQGAILRSAKTDYTHLVGLPDFEEQLREIMKHQHREMIRALVRGKCEIEAPAVDEKVSPAEAAKPVPTETKESRREVPAKSLDEILLEHISRKVRK